MGWDGIHAPKYRWLSVGGLGAAAAAAAVFVAPAFACTASSSLTLSPSRGLAGAAVSVRAVGFETTSSVTIKWGGPNGRSLATSTPDEAGNVQTTVIVPSDAVVQPGKQSAFYQLSAVQTKSDGTTLASSFVFEVSSPVPAPVSPPSEPASDPTPSPSADPPPPAQVEPAQAEPAQAEPAVVLLGATPASTNGTAGPAPARGPSSLSAQPVANRGAIVVTPSPAGPDPVAAPGVVDSASAAPGESAVSSPVLEPVPEVGVPAGDLWAGLQADTRSSLLDQPASERDSGVPTGGILIGAGLAVLGGLGLTAAQRRLAAAKVTSSR